MRIQINIHDTAGDDEYTGRVEALVAGELYRFAAQITRVEVHLADVNAAKGGGDDKRCMIEARPTGQKPVAVTHQAATMPLAIDGAIEKMTRLLDTSLGKRNDHKGAESIRDAGV